MARDPKFRFANYDGGLPSHSTPEPSGTLVLTGGKWELHYGGGFGKRDKWMYGGITRYPFTVSETSPTSCHVTMRDTQDDSISASFDLPDTPATALRGAIEAWERSLAVAKQNQQKIASGSWWLSPNAFSGLGLSKRLSVGETKYLGGWSNHPKPIPGKLNNFLIIESKGVTLGTGFKTLFTIPWDQVIELEIEGPETASKRVTVGRALALGVFSLAAKKSQKSAVIVARLRSGEEAIFQTEKYAAAELRAKLVPITSQLRKANTSSEPTAPANSSPPSAAPPPAATASVADELKKLAELKDAGLLTGEEFAGQKAKLLDP